MGGYQYLALAKPVVAIGGIAGALAAEAAFAFGVGLAAVDSGHDEYWWWLVPLTALPVAYVALVAVALRGHVRAAFIVAVVSWVVAICAWVNPLTGMVATAVALAATYLARARHAAAMAASGEPSPGPDWGCHP